ncbi:MAG: signal peptidase II, partial [Dialister sp.]|nr:signal peptidase II [Dialister sp.]
MVWGESIPLISGVFHLTYIINPGAAFGILAYQRWF